MKNIVGQTATGNNFFPRPRVINRIYRRVEAGANIFMAAPRRVGKTSIMLHLQDEPRPNFDFIYILTQSVNTSEEFFKRLLTETLKSTAISKLVQRSTSTKSLIKEITEKIDSIELLGIKMEFNDKEKEGSYFEQFEKLLTKLEPENKHIVIMVDEFPDAIENIRFHHGEQAARTFLQKNRELRQKAHPFIHFMYTGSIGLPLVVKKIMSLNVISDLNVIEVPPLSFEQAEQMVTKLFEAYKIAYEPTIIPRLLNELEWWIPYHIQLAVQELIDVHDAYGFLGKDAVDKAFTQLLHTRHDSSFHHYFSRLEQSFQDENDYQFALTLLHQLAKKGTVTVVEIEAIANQYNSNSSDTIVIDSLIFDGYISFNQQKKHYSFTSLLLKKWWSKKNL